MNNSAQDFAKIWSAKLSKLQRVLRRLPRDIGNEALHWFMENFKKQVDPGNKPWLPRKNGDGSRSLLVKSGRMRRSIKLNKVTSNSVVIGSNVDYAKYHNNGAGKIPQRQFLGRSVVLNRRLQRMIKAKILWALRS